MELSWWRAGGGQGGLMATERGGDWGGEVVASRDLELQPPLWAISHSFALCLSQAVSSKRLKPLLWRVFGLLVISRSGGCFQEELAPGKSQQLIPHIQNDCAETLSNQSLTSKMTVPKPQSGLYLLLSQLIIYLN